MMAFRHHLRIRDIRILIRAQLWVQILAAMALGIIVALLLSPAVGSPLALGQETSEELSGWLKLPGGLFLNLIQMVVIPLITTSIVLGLTSAEDPDFLRRAASRIVPYFVFTTTVAVIIGAVLAYLIEPGTLVDAASLSMDSIELEIDTADTGAEVGMAERLADLVPANLSEAQLSQNMLQIVIAAIIAGVALAALGSQRMGPLLQIVQLIQELAMKIVGWAMLLAPIAVFGLIADFVMQAGVSALYGVSAYIGTVLAGLLLLLSFYLAIVAFVARRHPIRFAKDVVDAQLLAFSTSSSAATMPLSLRIAEDRLAVSPPVARFIIPLGATVNMDGTALYQVVAALFVAQMFGIALAPAALAVLIVTVVGASIGSPSTPGVGIVVLATILQSIGIPAEGVAVILGVDRILDMCRTTVNVTGDLTACVVMDRWLAEKIPDSQLLEASSAKG